MNKVKKMNKEMAGYHMLMILSKVDGKSVKSEGKVISKYLADVFHTSINLEQEIEILETIPKEDYFIHFNNSMNDFYENSTSEERTKFLKFAVKIAKADNTITVEENKYLKELFFAWDSDHEDDSYNYHFSLS